MSTALTDLTDDTQAAVARLLAHAKDKGLTVRIDSTRRTCAEQAAEYAKGRTAPGNIVTNVTGCGSYHVLGRAVDIFIGSWNCPDYEELGEYWESIGGRWGGRFSFQDCVHFEWPHPLFGLDVLCPQGVSCEDAIKNEPPVVSPTIVAALGAALGAALAFTLRAR